MAHSSRWLYTLTLVTFLGFAIQGGQSLKDVVLKIMPPAVHKGQSASLVCQYDLEGAPLYSVKWYRGRHEFYRYSPNETPITKIFPFAGIHVDLSVSNESLVVLRKVGFNLSGNFSCEVTVDAPSFSTKTVTEPMLVVALPESPPVIETERDRYDPGDILRANCSSPPSKPPASLSFLLNNIPVGNPDIRHYMADEVLQSSALSLTMQLFPSHFNNGELVLKCTAYLASMYRETTELHLGTKAREPVPERVTSPNGTASARLNAPLQILLLAIGFYATR